MNRNYLVVTKNGEVELSADFAKVEESGNLNFYSNNETTHGMELLASFSWDFWLYFIDTVAKNA